MNDAIRTSGKAIASFVLGLISLVCALFAGIPALVLGLLALSDISREPQRLKGRGLAIAGVALGSIGCVLGTVGVLIALLLPAVQAARTAARRAQSSNNLKLIGLALHNYNSSYNTFPPAVENDSSGQPGTSWRVKLLPFIDEQALYQGYQSTEPWNSPANQTAMKNVPSTFHSPFAPPGDDISYVLVTDPDFVFNGTNGCRLSEISDGTSNTIIAVDAGSTGVKLAEPRDWSWQEFLQHFQNRAVGGVPGGFVGLVADGSVTFVPYDTDPATLRALFTKAGNEQVPMPAYNRR